MRLCLSDIQKAVNKASKQVSQTAENLKQELQLPDDKFFIVGGFVRDNVLSALYNKQETSKDIDIVLPKNPDFSNNPNVLCKKENSFGGIKLSTKNFPEIDIFNQHFSDATLGVLVGLHFDFNCNALYYSHEFRRIYCAANFYDFIGRQEINFLDSWYNIHNENLIEVNYPVHAMISRALKFEIEFEEKYGMIPHLGPNIMYLIFKMDKETEKKMFEYTNQKVKSEKLKEQIIENYRIRKY